MKENILFKMKGGIEKVTVCRFWSEIKFISVILKKNNGPWV